MIERHECFPAPADENLKLWRYMDLSKYLDLIQSRTLYFSRIDRLGDPFEGSSTTATAEAVRQQVLGSGMPPEDLNRLFSNLATVNKMALNENFVSCWHGANYESAAMWKLYSQSVDAVAIQSLYSRLASELPDCACMGCVEYLDYDSAVISQLNMFTKMMRKRRSFEHEREIRAVIWKRSDRIDGDISKDGRVVFHQTGALVNVDLNAIVEAVYVSPHAPSWFFDVVANVTKTYGLSAQVKQSALSGDPVY